MTTPGLSHFVIVLYSTFGYPHLSWVGDYPTREACIQAADRLWTGMWTCIDAKAPKPERLGDGDFSQ